MSRCTYRGKVLSIAGSDPSGGAGIQADIKTITMLGCYAACCITSLTVQNTVGVYGVYNVAPGVIEEQIAAVLSDISVDAIKIGMLPAESMEAVSNVIPNHIPVVLDPVAVSTSGFKLMDITADSLHHLLHKTTLVTPNIPEAETLSAIKIETLDDMKTASEAIFASFRVKNVLITGGYLEGEYANNLLFTGSEFVNFKNLKSSETLHGTGCTLSSAIASFIAQGFSIHQSTKLAVDYTASVAHNAQKVGRGFNPVFHNFEIINNTANSPT